MMNIWLKKIFYIVYIVVITSVVIEGIGRVIWVSDGEHLYWKKWQIFLYDTELGYKMKPGFYISGEQNNLYPGVDIRINSLGLRGAEPDERDVILLAGDSVVFGYGIHERESIAAQIEHQLEGRFQVLNAGVPGYNLEQISQWTKKLIEIFSPKAVVFLMNANDAESRYYLKTGGGTVSRFKCYPWEINFSPEIQLQDDPYNHWVISAIPTVLSVRELPRSRKKKESDTEVYEKSEHQRLAFWNSNDHEAIIRINKALAVGEALISELISADIIVVIARYPWRVSVTNPEVKDFQSGKWLKLLTSSNGASIDLWPFLYAANKQKPQYLPADGHPNPAGSKTIARAIMMKLSKIL